MKRTSRVEARVSPQTKAFIQRICPQEQSAAIRTLLIIGLAACDQKILPSLRGEIIALVEEIPYGPAQHELEALLRTGGLSGQVAANERAGNGQVAANERTDVRMETPKDEMLDDDEQEFIS